MAGEWEAGNAPTRYDRIFAVTCQDGRAGLRSDLPGFALLWSRSEAIEMAFDLLEAAGCAVAGRGENDSRSDGYHKASVEWQT